MPGSDLCFNGIVPLDAVGVGGFKKGKTTKEHPTKGLCRPATLTTRPEQWCRVGDDERFTLFPWKKH